MDSLASITLVLLGGILCVGLARGLHGGRRLAAILLGVFAVRVILGLALHVIATRDLPWLRGLRLPGGFWAFAPDAAMYHANAMRIAAALAAGTELPPITTIEGVRLSEPPDFVYYVAGLYHLLGPNPLYVPLLNASLDVGTAAVAYALGRRLGGGGRSAEAAALVVAFWPSALIWSSQILKDPLVTFLTLTALLLIIRLWESSRRTVVPRAALLMGTIALLAGNRPHAAVVLPLGLAVALVGMSLRAFGTVRAGPVARGTGLLLLVGATAIGALAVRAPSQPAEAGGTGAGPAASGVASTPHRPARTMGLARQLVQAAMDPVPSLDRLRQALLVAGGASTFAADVRFTRAWDVLAFLPRAMAYALYYPLPGQWRPGGATGAFRTLAAVEAIALLALTPLVALSLVDAVRTAKLEACLLLGYGVLLLVALALVVPNAGTLVRLRLQAVVPLLIVAVPRVLWLIAGMGRRPGLTPPA